MALGFAPGAEEFIVYPNPGNDQVIIEKPGRQRDFRLGRQPLVRSTLMLKLNDEFFFPSGEEYPANEEAKVLK